MVELMASPTRVRTNDQAYREVVQALETSGTLMAQSTLAGVSLTRCGAEDQSLLVYALNQHLKGTKDVVSLRVANFLFTYAAITELSKDPMIEVFPGKMMHWTDWVFMGKDYLTVLTNNGYLINRVPLNLLMDLIQRKCQIHASSLGKVFAGVIDQGVHIDDLYTAIKLTSEDVVLQADFISSHLYINPDQMLKNLVANGFDINQTHVFAQRHDRFCDLVWQHFNPAQQEPMQLTWPALMCLIGGYSFIAPMSKRMHDPLAPAIKIGQSSYHMLELLTYVHEVCPNYSKSLIVFATESIQASINKALAQQSLKDIRNL